MKNELRIGNLISFDDYSSNIFSVSELHENHLTAIGGKNETWANPYESAKRILINGNERILMLVYGFSYDTTLSQYYIHNHLDEDIKIEVEYADKDGYALYLKCVDSNRTILVRYIKYIHEIQNFYHSITGEELKTKSDATTYLLLNDK